MYISCIYRFDYQNFETGASERQFKYLDNFLILGQTEEECSKNMDFTFIRFYDK